VDNSAPSVIRPESTYKSGNAVQTTGATSLRLDIDPKNEPDILGSILNLSNLANESVDAIYSSHSIEHIYAHEISIALDEFRRVLKPDGFLVATCPDLQSVCAAIVDDRLTAPLYQSRAGPISPLDILYGHTAAISSGHLYMAHKCGFTLKSLTDALDAAGFQTIAGKRRLSAWDLWVLAFKGLVEQDKIRTLAHDVFPA
jgi:SAM-dependent methyltransferase